jgi:hypothetical protein
MNKVYYNAEINELYVYEESNDYIIYLLSFGHIWFCVGEL